jgi:lipopolysaccharide/colanic/teichoic acid biosynthesis glycosyltransferase
MIKRVFDLVCAFLGLLVLTPLLFLVGVWIKLDSKGPIFYVQTRVGRNNINFKLYKFRTMKPNADKFGLITTSSKDSRITHIGYYLRKFKIDEFPQLFNVVLGNMSLVGPRPEVRKYVDIYTPEQRKVLEVKPGITDISSIVYSNENEILESKEDPEKYYREIILPDKIERNLKYLESRNLFTDIGVILSTFKKITT